MHIAVAVSGGVDSLSALVRLRRAGHELVALYGRFHDSLPTDPVPGLREACARLETPLHIADLREEFGVTVRRPFAQALYKGLTPNPCALCNARIKFGALRAAARAAGCDALATGHYARLEQGPGGPWLARAADGSKDQCYFLALVPQGSFENVLFPLAGYTKEENRALVGAAGLAVPVPTESQDVCFLPPGDAGGQEWTVLTAGSHLPEPLPGPLVLHENRDTERTAGQHRGLWRYTLGQRRGLGIAHTEGLYVLGKDSSSNTLHVGPRSMLGSRGCVTATANFFCPREYWPKALFVRLRYRQQAMPANVRVDDGGRLHITLVEPQYPAAAGQVAAVYDEDGHILAGGEVETVLPGV